MNIRPEDCFVVYMLNLFTHYLLAFITRVKGSLYSKLFSEISIFKLDKDNVQAAHSTDPSLSWDCVRQSFEFSHFITIVVLNTNQYKIYQYLFN